MGVKIHLAQGQYRLCDGKSKSKDDVTITNGNKPNTEGKIICKKCVRMYYK